MERMTKPGSDQRIFEWFGRRFAGDRSNQLLQRFGGGIEPRHRLHESVRTLVRHSGNSLKHQRPQLNRAA